MKGIKKLSVLGLGLAFILSISSCASTGGNSSSDTTSSTTPVTTSGDPTQSTTSTTTSTTPTPTDPPVENIDVDIEAQRDDGDVMDVELDPNMPSMKYNEENAVTYYALGMDIDTTDVRKKFYLGEQLNADNLKVQITLAKLDADGNVVIDSTKNYVASVTNFSVDFSKVDIDTLGAYTVSVSYRYGGELLVKTYDIVIESSVFEKTPRLEYVAGAKVNYKADKTGIDSSARVLTVSKNSTFAISKDDFVIEKIINKVNRYGSAVTATAQALDLSNLVDDTNEKKLSDDKLTIDYSRVDTSKEGTYMIKVTYNNGIITVDGIDYPNVVESFVLVVVE